MKDEDIKKEENILSLSDIKDLLNIVYLLNSLIKNEGNITRSADELDLGRRTIYDLMERYEISCSDGKLTIKLSPLISNLEVRSAILEKYLK